MSRIFVSLSSLAFVLMACAFFLGLRIGGINVPYREFWTARQDLRQMPTQSLQPSPEWLALQDRKSDQLKQLEAIRPRVTTHTMFGMLTALVTLLVHSVCITYFIGTAKWCGEVVGSYQLDNSLYQESRSLKRKCFPWSALGIVALLSIITLGAAADPGTLRGNTWNWVQPHLWGAAVGMTMTLVSFWKQWDYLLQNVRVIERVQQQVRQVRDAHGLD